MASYMYYPNYAAPHRQHPFHGHSQSMGSVPPINAYGYYHHPSAQPYYQPQRHHSVSYQMMLPPPGINYMPPCNMPPPQLAPVSRLQPQPQTQPQPQQHEPQPQQEQTQVNGGVREVLDYDLNLMSEFVVKNAYLIFENEDAFNSEASSIVDIFTKGVSSVLNATRLPSVTIFMALDYLCKYISKLPNGVESAGGDSVNAIYQNLMVSFVLANKFNDDKTFTNKSWSHATGMETSVINQNERDWLSVFEWRLFDDQFMLYEDYAKSFELFCWEKKSPVHPFNGLRDTAENYVTGSVSEQPNVVGYQTPMNAPSMVYSSPCYTEERSGTSNSFYQPNYASPLSNGSPVSKGGFNGYSYNYYSAPLPANPLPPMPVNSLWGNQMDDFYSQAQFGPSNGYYCFPSN